MALEDGYNTSCDYDTRCYKQLVDSLKNPGQTQPTRYPNHSTNQCSSHSTKVFIFVIYILKILFSLLQDSGVKNLQRKEAVLENSNTLQCLSQVTDYRLVEGRTWRAVGLNSNPRACETSILITLLNLKILFTFFPCNYCLVFSSTLNPS